MVVFFAYLAIWANTDFIAGSHFLFVDERLTFNGVKKILNAKDLPNFLYMIFDGNDHRYGRILWNSMAITSAIPEYFGGESWQIVAGRITQAVILFSAYLVFSSFIIKNQALKIFTLFCLLVIPFSAYYQTLPKTEPKQLLFLSLFFALYQNN